MSPKATRSTERSAPKIEFHDKLKLNYEFTSGNYILKEPIPQPDDPAIYDFHAPGDPLRLLLHNLTHGTYPRIYSLTVAFDGMSHGELLQYFTRHEALKGWPALLARSYAFSCGDS